MAKKFPTFHSHEEASCFNCGADLDGSYLRDSGNAPKHGQWEQYCEKCRMTTWYDVMPSPVHLECIGANHFRLHLKH